MTDLPTAVATDRTTALEALRDHLAALLQDASPREAAPLAAQLRQVLADLSAGATSEGSPVDDLAARRAARRSAAGSARP